MSAAFLQVVRTLRTLLQESVSFYGYYKSKCTKTLHLFSKVCTFWQIIRFPSRAIVARCAKVSYFYLRNEKFWTRIKTTVQRFCIFLLQFMNILHWNVLLRMSSSECPSQNVLLRMSSSECPPQNVLLRMSSSEYPPQNILLRISSSEISSSEMSSSEIRFSSRICPLKAHFSDKLQYFIFLHHCCPHEILLSSIKMFLFRFSEVFSYISM